MTQKAYEQVQFVYHRKIKKIYNSHSVNPSTYYVWRRNHVLLCNFSSSLAVSQCVSSTRSLFCDILLLMVLKSYARLLYFFFYCRTIFFNLDTGFSLIILLSCRTMTINSWKGFCCCNLKFFFYYV